MAQRLASALNNVQVVKSVDWQSHYLTFIKIMLSTSFIEKRELKFYKESCKKWIQANKLWTAKIWLE